MGNCFGGEGTGREGGGPNSLRVRGAGGTGSGGGSGSGAPEDKGFKIVMVGDVAVGKTCVLQRFAHGRFTEEYVSTIGASFVEKQVHINTGGQDQSLTLHTWDTSGEERFSALSRLYFREARGAVLVYSVDDDRTLAAADKWLTSLREVAPDAVVALVGNKTDLPRRAGGVPTSRGQAWAEERDLMFFECSAKRGDGVTDVFEQLCVAMLVRHATPDSRGPAQQGY